MAERLPVDNSDAGVWGGILLGWLLAEHDTAGGHDEFLFWEGELLAWENDPLVDYTYTN